MSDVGSISASGLDLKTTLFINKFRVIFTRVSARVAETSVRPTWSRLDFSTSGCNINSRQIRILQFKKGKAS